MHGSSDIVIVGGGVMGSATAFFLLSDPGFSGRVTVVEKDPTYRFASSALSASSIRQQFSTPLNIQLSLFGIGFLRDIGRHLALPGETLTIGLREPGYLIMATAEHEALLRRNVELQRAHGADTTVLSPADMKQRFPWIETDGVAAAGFGLTGEGSFDGPALMQAFRRKAASIGARYVHGEVVAVEKAGPRVAAVRLADGTRIACGAMVLAAGPSSGAVAALAPDRGTLHVVHDEIPGLLFAGTHEFHADAPTIASVQLGRRLFGRIEQRAGQWWLFDVRLAQ